MPRIAVIEKDKCHPEKCGWLCYKLCPINKAGTDCIVKGEDSKAEIYENVCNGCGICPKRCPFGAISIINLPEKLDFPIHRFGHNGFHLYSLPIPLFGKVVGLLGRNGIGKSTALSILAGELFPNFGKEVGIADWNALVQFFKGSESQIFFEKRKAGAIKISFKPQKVERIPLFAKGKVRKILEKIDEKKEIDSIAQELDIAHLLDNDMETLSGGELQRVAIAAAALKKANCYMFDEPTSYLDIRQRVRIADYFRKLTAGDTAVFAIEHDLVILDTMADLIHIMYGKEACYGIASTVKPARVGINTYLEGYLRDDNVRFRPTAIKFERRPPVQQKETPDLLSWKGVKKELGRFRMEAPGGSIKKNHVMGILGENGIGKTTFVKLLAGEISADEGSITLHNELKEIRVSYKPQYIPSGSEETVFSYLQHAMKFENQVLFPLNIKPLYDKRICDLSGGELQRVAIAGCLGKDAEIYVLDEPSAHLDVEQRLIVSKVIREFMELKGTAAVIVDHDLLFLDYISTQLLVCEGTSGREGILNGPFTMADGMNRFLKGMNITFRRDPESGRPRANKPDSQMDQMQKKQNMLYYSL